MFSGLKTKILAGFLFSFWSILLVQAQIPKRYNASEIQLALQKLQVLGSVLYVAAHPDDENTRLIAYLSKEKLFNTAYLSLTRGDGGQNLIGPEIRESLGIIRTQELLAARRIDGGKQFFSRANDFGYSKHPDETFNIWQREEVLSDMVWVIRKFQPDVIITRFNSEPGTTHGHHTASAILAEEAFELAGDPEAFPEQLEYTNTWSPKKLYWNTSWWFYGSRDFDKSGLLTINVGEYNPLLGRSYTEVAAESRSQHRSQGFGAAGTRGQEEEYLKPIKNARPNESLFAGINTSWDQLPGGEQVDNLVQQALDQFDPFNPSAVVPLLVKTYTAIEQVDNTYWKKIKLNELKQIIEACLGLYLEVTADDPTATNGDSLELDFEMINRSPVPVNLEKVCFFDQDTLFNQQLQNNQKVNFKKNILLPTDMPFSQPYWLKEEGTLGMFNVDQQEMIGMPENPPAITVQFDLEIAGKKLPYDVPLVYKQTDPARGEIYKPFQVTPPVFTIIDNPVYVFGNSQAKEVNVLVKAGKGNISGELRLEIPPGWQVKPEKVQFDLALKGEEKNFMFSLIPPEKSSSGELKAVTQLNGQTFSYSLVTIDYEHIPTQSWFPQAIAKVVKIDLKKKGDLIGYIPGAGDAIPENLEQIGYKINILQDQDFLNGNLDQYDAIITGIRAYNTNERLVYYQPRLMEYVKQGGTLVIQYNTSHRLVLDDLGPYPLELSRDRVAVEDAPVKILAPQHEVLNQPNKITSEDFDFWVQERGLYFPNKWDERFVPILSSHDPGEDPRDGGLLIAEFGQGHFVYSGYSWFRQLPAGVPGAYRLFTNIISLGN
ncbi:MAG: PIG-L family deacetylase [Candidatus Cyclobacteriaceae bacterium M3_2C_046]